MTTTTITTEDLADVPHPAGATHVAEWYEELDGGATRHFQGTLRQVPEVYGGAPEYDVLTAGDQTHDGTVDRYFGVGGM
jgi:hypothetical protein